MKLETLDLQIKVQNLDLHISCPSLVPPQSVVTAHPIYRKTSCISRTEYQNFNVCRLVLQLSLANPLKPGVKSSMKM